MPEQTRLTAKQFAEHMDVPLPKVYAWILSGELRALDVSLKPGCGNPRWRIPVEAIKEFEEARSNRQPAAPQAEPAPARAPRRRPSRQYV